MHVASAAKAADIESDDHDDMDIPFKFAVNADVTGAAGDAN